MRWSRAARRITQRGSYQRNNPVITTTDYRLKRPAARRHPRIRAQSKARRFRRGRNDTCTAARVAQAREILRESIREYGFDTADLRDARELRDELGG
jgi:hypothetical protein